MKPSNLERKAGEQANRRAPLGFPVWHLPPTRVKASFHKIKGVETRPNKKAAPRPIKLLPVLRARTKLQGELDSQGA